MKSAIAIAIATLYGCMLMHFALAQMVHSGLHHYKSSLHSHAEHHHSSHDHSHALLKKADKAHERDNPSEIVNTFTVLECIVKGEGIINHPSPTGPQKALGLYLLPFLSRHSTPSSPPPQAIS